MASEPNGMVPTAQDPPENPAEPSILPSRETSPLPSASARGKGARRMVVSMSRQEVVFSGPLPHPGILKEYDEIVPGTTDRILRQAEQQTNHRIGLEAKVIDADIRRADRGLWAGLAVAIVSIVGGCALVFADHDWAGATIATATVVSLVTVFVYGSQARKQERERRVRLMTSDEEPQPAPTEPPEAEPDAEESA